MARTTRRAATTFLALAAAGCAATASGRAAGAGAADVDRVRDDVHAAAAAADFDRYFGHFARASVFLGTDATERWTLEQFKAYARPAFRPGGGWTYHPRGRVVTFTPDGRTAFFDELLDNAGLGETRGSGVLVLEDGEWKVAQYNLSIPIPNELADTVVGLIRRRR